MSPSAETLRLAQALAVCAAHRQALPLLVDPAKAKLAWVPEMSINALAAERVREDLKSAEWDELIDKLGCKTFDYHE